MATRPEIADALNTISAFLAHPELDSIDAVNEFWNNLRKETIISDQNEHDVTDVIVLCASEVLRPAETVFSALSETGLGSRLKPTSKLALVLCGGIGHSTDFLYRAVSRHPLYKTIASEIDGLPEARVLQRLGERWFDLPAPSQLDGPSQVKTGVQVLVEDRSTNCGANASESRKLLEAHGIRNPRSIVVMQDPTMCRRTTASFLKTYEDLGSKQPVVRSWPTFIPTVAANNKGIPLEAKNGFYGGFDFTVPGVDEEQLWTMDRFVDLTLGEISRLRDDADGYGPLGRGFIGHVDIPIDIEQCWGTVTTAMERNGREAPARY